MVNVINFYLTATFVNNYIYHLYVKTPDISFEIGMFSHNQFKMFPVRYHYWKHNILYVQIHAGGARVEKSGCVM